MLALKLLGAGMLVICGFFLGLKKANICEEHAKILLLMTAFLTEIRACIKYKRNNSINMLCELSCAEKYIPLSLKFENVPAPEWPSCRSVAIKNFTEVFNGVVPKEELSLFCEAISAVGMENAQTEDERLEFYCIKLKECETTACKLAAKNKKLYTGVGLFAGAAIAIILL